MANNQAAQDQQEQEYAAAFNDDSAPTPEQSENEAFGIDPEGAANEGSGDEQGDAPAVAIDGEAAAPETPVEPEAPQVEGGVAEEATETPADEAAEQPEGGQMTEQQLRSWEGRLKKQQADLDAKSQGADTPAAEEIQQVADDVKSGEITADEAISKLSEDFGAEFVSMIKAIANQVAADTASGAVSEVSHNVDSIINHISDTNKRRHFEEIASAHPDFMEVHTSPEFIAWVDALPESEQSDSKRYLESGNSKEINGVLAAFKKSQQQTDKNVSDHGDIHEDGADAAEGVRSGGIQLPTEPDNPDALYEDAWDKA